ncbi:MAG: hypothetical protein ACK5X3_21695 [Pseudomonadota bacterium]|jgi:hypothetical protein
MPVASQFISTSAVTELRLLKLDYIYVSKLLGFDHIYVIRLSTDRPGFTWSGKIAVAADTPSAKNYMKILMLLQPILDTYSNQPICKGRPQGESCPLKQISHFPMRPSVYPKPLLLA